MLSYRHIYHAGNHADVLKHLVLTSTLFYATRKDAPVFYLDTHAGAGLYHLQSEQALQTGEAGQGILKLDQAALLAGTSEEGRATLQFHFDQLKPFLKRQQYPGSPLLAAAVLRQQDHLHLCELHPADYESLLHRVDGDRCCTCEQADGYQRALALLPPAQKRAVVLIDPSYEVKDDYRKVAKLVGGIHQRMRGAQVLVWYPVVARADVDYMITLLERGGVRDLWQFELGVAPDQHGHGLTASGMLVVNPPFTLSAQLREILPALQQQLAPAYGHWLVKNLVAE
ncbi:MAG TPA: 23S rRNA (adenine(2030)-N(6))-methyltransferase RlmJ [Candidatus Acidoferrum sp.]|nr:23S rRNA (adenine(2030)-N(6))-methyltransferase RlmJ [Candidatus Acidoferrum sp.]